MRFLLRHPVLTGLAFEILLVASGMYFAMPSHRRPDIISAVDAIHYPANTFVIGMAELLELPIQSVQLLVLTSTFTAPVWIVLLYVVGGFVDPRLGSAPRRVSRRVQSEARDEPLNLQVPPPHEPPLVPKNAADSHPSAPGSSDRVPFSWQRS